MSEVVQMGHIDLDAYREALKGILERVHLIMVDVHCIRSFQMLIMDGVSGRARFSRSVERMLHVRLSKKLAYSKSLVRARKMRKKKRKVRKDKGVKRTKRTE